MRTIDLRIALEEAGATLTIENGELVVAEPIDGLPGYARALIDKHRGALKTLVILYPCRASCGTEPFAGLCKQCPMRPRKRRKGCHHASARGAR